MSAADLPRVGIIITSKNRKELLRRTLRETMRQTYRPLEVAVFDDGSTDGTEEMIRAEFPSVRVERSAQSKGYIRSRNRAADVLADCKYLISLDDDSWLLNDDGAAKVVELFERHPDTAAVCLEIFMPYHLPLAPDPARDGAEIAFFAGCGYAIDRERFIELGRFPEFFDFYSEETDFVMRVMGSPWTCRFLSSAPVYHVETNAGRNRERIVKFSLANTLSTVCMREPLWFCVPHVAYLIARNFLEGIRRGELGYYLAGVALWMGRGGSISAARKPIPYSALRKFRRLQREWRDYFHARRGSGDPRREMPME